MGKQTILATVPLRSQKLRAISIVQHGLAAKCMAEAEMSRKNSLYHENLIKSRTVSKCHIVTSQLKFKVYF